MIMSPTSSEVPDIDKLFNVCSTSTSVLYPDLIQTNKLYLSHSEKKLKKNNPKQNLKNRAFYLLNFDFCKTIETHFR